MTETDEVLSKGRLRDRLAARLEPIRRRDLSLIEEMAAISDTTAEFLDEIDVLLTQRRELLSGEQAVIPQTREHAEALYAVAVGCLKSYGIDHDRRTDTAGTVGEEAAATLEYTNWRGEHSTRILYPRSVWFGATEWHPEPQWLLRAWDVEKGAERDFALKDFGTRSPTGGREAGTAGELDAVELDMIRHGDMLGSKLGAKVFASLSPTGGRESAATIVERYPGKIENRQEIADLIRSGGSVSVEGEILETSSGGREAGLEEAAKWHDEQIEVVRALLPEPGEPDEAGTYGDLVRAIGVHSQSAHAIRALLPSEQRTPADSGASLYVEVDQPGDES